MFLCCLLDFFKIDLSKNYLGIQSVSSSLDPDQA